MSDAAEWPSLGRKINTPGQLLVEGRTPEIFFREWLEAIGLKDKVEVRDYKSLTDLTDFLKVFTRLKEFQESVVSLAIIRDAEDKPASYGFNSVCSALRAVSLTCPAALGSFSNGTPRTGVFVLPDCQQAGMLETLCWSVLEDDEKITGQLECVAGYLACLRNSGGKIHNEPKAKVWTHLAGKGHFDPQVGRAAQKKVFDWGSEALKPLSQFLKSL